MNLSFNAILLSANPINIDKTEQEIFPTEIVQMEFSYTTTDFRILSSCNAGHEICILINNLLLIRESLPSNSRQ